MIASRKNEAPLKFAPGGVPSVVSGMILPEMKRKIGSMTRVKAINEVNPGYLNNKA